MSSVTAPMASNNCIAAILKQVLKILQFSFCRILDELNVGPLRSEAVQYSTNLVLPYLSQAALASVTATVASERYGGITATLPLLLCYCVTLLFCYFITLLLNQTEQNAFTTLLFCYFAIFTVLLNQSGINAALLLLTQTEQFQPRQNGSAYIFVTAPFVTLLLLLCHFVNSHLSLC